MRMAILEELVNLRAIDRFLSGSYSLMSYASRICGVVYFRARAERCGVIYYSEVGIQGIVTFRPLSIRSARFGNWRGALI